MSTLKEKAEARRQQMINILRDARAEAARRKQAKKAKSTGPPAPTKTTTTKPSTSGGTTSTTTGVVSSPAPTSSAFTVPTTKSIFDSQASGQFAGVNVASTREVADKNQAARTTSTTTGVVSSPAPTSSAFTVPTTKSIFDSQAMLHPLLRLWILVKG